MTLGFLPPFQTHQRSSQLQTAPKPLRNRSETAWNPPGIRSHSPRKRSNKEINERIGLKSSNDNPMITTAATAATTTATITIMMMITVINNPDKKRGQKRETEREGNGGKKIYTKWNAGFDLLRRGESFFLCLLIVITANYC